MIVLQYRCRNSVGYLEASIPLRLDFYSQSTASKSKNSEPLSSLVARKSKSMLFCGRARASTGRVRREREGGETERETERRGFDLRSEKLWLRLHKNL
jgi:hypothetical protein